MTPIKTTVAHDPANGTYGDCFRAVMASLLDLPITDVPHFFETGNRDIQASWTAVDTFLALRGLAWSETHFNGKAVPTVRWMLESIKFMYRDTYIVLCGLSRRGNNHAVIVLNGEVVADPSADNTGIIGPATNGFYTVGVIVPLSMKRKK
jgi:hypothetical protein